MLLRREGAGGRAEPCVAFSPLSSNKPLFDRDKGEGCGGGGTVTLGPAACRNRVRQLNRDPRFPPQTASPELSNASPRSLPRGSPPACPSPDLVPLQDCSSRAAHPLARRAHSLSQSAGKLGCAGSLARTRPPLWPWAGPFPASSQSCPEHLGGPHWPLVPARAQKAGRGSLSPGPLPAASAGSSSGHLVYGNQI